jgi:hypothetical protein
MTATTNKKQPTTKEEVARMYGYASVADAERAARRAMRFVNNHPKQHMPSHIRIKGALAGALAQVE